MDGWSAANVITLATVLITQTVTVLTLAFSMRRQKQVEDERWRRDNKRDAYSRAMVALLHMNTHAWNVSTGRTPSTPDTLDQVLRYPGVDEDEEVLYSTALFGSAQFVQRLQAFSGYELDSTTKDPRALYDQVAQLAADVTWIARQDLGIA